MFWCVSECFKAPLWVAGLTSISLVSLSDVVTMYIGSGWPDHHGLMTLLFVLTLGLSIRIAAGEAHKWDFLSFGLAQALAVWISPESFVPMVALYGGLVLVWLVEGCDERAKTSLLSSLVLVLGVALALCLEYGLTWPGFVLDRLSLFSLLLAGVMSAVWAGIWFCPKPLNRSILLRCVWVLGLSLVGSVTIIVLVPHVLSGPMAEADVWFVTTWSEVFGDGFRRVIWDGWVLVVLALACLLVLYKRKPTLCLALAPILLMSGVLSEVDSPRWIVYGKIVAIMVMVYGFSFLWPRLTALGDGIAAILARACSLSFVLLAPLILTYILTLWDGPSLMAGPVQTPSASQPCSVQSLLPFLEAQPHTRLLTHANVSPAFLYFSKHDVMAVPIHPNAKAVHDSVRILIGNNDATALGLLKKYGIGLIIMCATGHENIAYGSTHDGLYARALRGQGPKWLQPLETPQSAFRVFAVQN
ncbi:MAG: hypothetical protein JKY92_09310 [Magnetovibrio sp.]|nr:hypothetical protein [Magnetovibrio sp.]